MKLNISKLKNGIFSDAYHLIRNSPKPYFANIALDLVFLMLVYIVGTIGKVSVAYLKSKNNVAAMMLMLLVYFLLIILVYSLTKGAAVSFVKAMPKMTKLQLSKTKEFYLLNIIGFFLLFAILLIVSKVVVGGIRESILKWTSRIVIGLFSIIVFALIGVVHSLFALGSGIKKSIKDGFKIVFTGFSKYYGVIVINILVLGVFLGVYKLISWLIGLAFTVNTGRYDMFFAIIGIALFYVVQAYNRVYFYLIVKHIKHA